MTENDRIGVLYSAQEERKMVRAEEDDARKSKNIGGLQIKKANGKSAYGAAVANLLWHNNGTYVWDRSDPLNGAGSFRNIYQLMAADHYTPGGDLRERLEASQMYENDMRAGISDLVKFLDKKYGIPLYRCTTNESGNKVVIITVHPDTVVDDITGDTAKAVQRRRDKKAIHGQARASIHRLSRDHGENEAIKMLQDAFEDAVEEGVAKPERTDFSEK